LDKPQSDKLEQSIEKQIQKPGLFDFSRKSRDAVVVRITKEQFIVTSKFIQDDDEEKRITPEEFANNRSDTSKPIKIRRRKLSQDVGTKKNPKDAGKEIKPDLEEEVATLGVTVWRMRPSNNGDEHKIVDIIGAPKGEE